MLKSIFLTLVISSTILTVPSVRGQGKKIAQDPVAAEFPHQYLPENVPDPGIAKHFPNTWTTYSSNQGRNAVFALPEDAPPFCETESIGSLQGRAQSVWTGPH